MTQDFVDALHGNLHFDSAELAFCTHYSWIGVSKQDRLGVEGLHLYYNRHAGLLSPNLLTFRVERPDGATDGQTTRADRPLQIEESDGRGFSGRIAFADADILCYHASLAPDSEAANVTATLSLPATEPRFLRRVRFDQDAGLLTIETRQPRTDGRDPDPDHPLTLCLLIPSPFAIRCVTVDGEGSGQLVDTDGALTVEFAAPAAGLPGKERTFLLGVGEGPAAEDIEQRVLRLNGAPDSYDASQRWLTEALKDFTFDGVSDHLRPQYAKAVYQLLSNTKAPRGRIGRLASFPNRATYCCHYLWDSCFTNLGVAQFNPKLAEGFLLNLCENQEEDGKIPHFICATWNRPGETQPPLIAWAAWWLYEKFGNNDLIGAVYGPLCRMVGWWFANRDADGDGVVEYSHPLESGWDDSPRFDLGRIAAVDLNAYLYREMRILAQMAPIAGKPENAVGWEQRAAAHRTAVIERLFDPEDGLFYDRLVEEDRLHKILTPASFMPLWCEMVPDDHARRMISKYLLDPKRFFGPCPFPSVAYDEPTYGHSWWRGPIWMPIAWAMTEVLRLHGFAEERSQAVRRLVDMMAARGDLAELYDSSNGEPLGSPTLNWTCATFMDLARSGA